jgi:hypothetical protein
LAERDPREAALEGVLMLHEAVDLEIQALVRHHGARLRCRQGCTACCGDGLTVFRVEAERIRRFAPHVLRGAPHAPGACAFLDDAGACRVYVHRPYVCRTRGLPLRWAEAGATDEELVERRDICPLNAQGLPLERLAEDECWTLGPVEEWLASLQVAWGDGGPARVALRDLFAAAAARAAS